MAAYGYENKKNKPELKEIFVCIFFQFLQV